MASRDLQWQSILAATEAMQQAAGLEDWECVSTLAQNRDLLIHDFFACPLSADEALAIQDDMIQILARDEAILGEARRAQALTTLQKRGDSLGQKAANHYQQNAKL